MDTATARARIAAELDRMAQRHQVLDAHLRNADREMPADWAERATVIENDEVLEALDEAALHRLRALKGALQRVEDGSYGVCVDCGETIPDGRLEALPAATRCTSCAA